MDPAEISAANDSKYVDVYNTGHVALNVLPNDSFDNGPATTGNVDIYLDDDDGSGNLHLNESTGDVSVDSGTSPGTYWLEYYICAQAEENCSDGAANDGKPAKVTITVGDPLVVASNDSGSVASGELGGVAVANVLANDSFDGGPASLTDLTLNEIDGASQLTLNVSTGSVSVAPQTPYGDHHLDYEICFEHKGGSTCSSAEVDVFVDGTEIEADPDSASAYPNSAAVVNVLGNDSYDGSPATPGSVTLSVVGSTNGLTFDTSTGSISVPTGTAAGSHVVNYEICSKVQAWNCSTSFANINVLQDRAPLAVDDTAQTPFGSPVTVHVLQNDSDPDGDTISVNSPSPAAAHGTVSCTASDCTYTPAAGFTGSDSFVYTISDGQGHTVPAAVYVTVGAQPQANLSLSMIAPRSVPAGSTALFTLNVHNGGPDAASGVVVTDTLPDGLTLDPGSVTVSGAAGASCTVTGTTITCTAPTLPAGQTLTITFSARVLSAAAVLLDQAAVTSSTSDPVATDNVSAASLSVTAVPAQKLAPAKTTLSLKNTALIPGGGKAKLHPGQVFSYRVVVTNTGKHAASNVRVCEQQSRSLVYLSAKGAKFSKSNVCWKIATLAAGKSRTFTVKMRVDNTAPQGVIRSTAVASAANANRSARSVASSSVAGTAGAGRAGGVTG